MAEEKTVTVTVAAKLAQYLAKKGADAIVMDLAECQSCGGDVCEAFARVARPGEAARLLEASAAAGETVAVNQYDGNRTRVRAYDCVDEAGAPLMKGDSPVQLLVVHRLIRVESQVTIDMRRVLGIVDLTVKGAAF